MRLPAPSVLISVALLAVGGPAAKAADPSFLLRTRSLTTDAARGLDLEVEITLFNDGLVLERSVNQGQDVFLLRATATPEALMTLKKALSSNRVGQQLGDCKVASPLPVDRYVSTVTWFGRQGRVHSFRVGDLFATTCPVSTLAIVGAVDTYVQASRETQGVQTVEFQQ